MTAFLASVSNMTEADLVLRSDVDILDLKDVETGSLGVLPAWRWRQIASCYRHRVLISATLGDPPYVWERLRRLASMAARAGVHFVKVGLCDDTDIAVVNRLVLYLSRMRVGVVVVFLVGEKLPDLSRLPLIGRVSAVMLDTTDKQAGRLTRRLSLIAISRFVAAARHCRLPVGLAGSLIVDDILPLLSLRPDYLGFRGALCNGNERTRGLSPSAVRRIRSLIARHPSNVFSIPDLPTGQGCRTLSDGEPAGQSLPVLERVEESPGSAGQGAR